MQLERRGDKQDCKSQQLGFVSHCSHRECRDITNLLQAALMVSCSKEGQGSCCRAGEVSAMQRRQGGCFGLFTYSKERAGRAALRALALAGVITALQRQGHSPRLPSCLSPHPSHQDPSPLPGAMLAAGEPCQPTSPGLAFALNVGQPEQDENLTLFSPRVCLIMKYKGRSL